ncbi:MAG: FAD-dependent 5-carboxymethylaminomethyl-2-thiouridine(34) oxidoreductase MnmC [Pelomonas sp.]|nr:FAD-dependent 5-carboxymethylaminomethyl-2-thiouridine(34) oxidoreductase MnmC [Roseateles sp.]
MKTQPIVPADVDFSDPAAPASPAFGDIYHARAGALVQARHVFLAGSGLPQRWQGRARFVVLETGFGLGNNFLATWQAWRDDPARCERLVFVSVDKHPLRRADLERAHAGSALPDLARELVAAWPPLTPNLHTLDFEQGRVRLLLAFGDAREGLKQLVADVDAFYLDGFAPAKNPELWDPYLFKSLARLAAPGATAATWSVAPGVLDGLRAAGFDAGKVPGFAQKGRVLRAVFAPRHTMRKPAGRAALAPDARDAIVVGAGLAGAACAHALMREGLRCLVVDARPGPAQASSGNPAGLFHATVHPGDATHARWSRATALRTAARLRELALPGVQPGLLRIETGRPHAEMQALIDAQRLPDDFVQALDAAAAGARSGLPLAHPAWFYPQGGALVPPQYVQALLAGAATRYGCAVASARHDGTQWQLLDAAGQPIAAAPVLVLAGGHEGVALLPDALPLLRQRGQLSHLAEPGPAVPLAGGGYAIPDGAGGLWCGATNADEDFDATLRAADQAANVAQWRALSNRPASANAGDAPLAGRVAWRLLAPDRLPLIGGLPDPAYAGRRDQLRLIPRRPGLALCTAFGARGIGYAALAGEIVAALLTGAPCPVEADLLDAVDPARCLR